MRPTNLLTDARCKNAKPRQKAYKLADGQGLYLEVSPTGHKSWRWSYRDFHGKRPRLSFDTYPEVSLVEAREQRAFYRGLLRKGIDPSLHKKQQKRQARIDAGTTFEQIAREWHKLQTEWSEQYAKDVLKRLEQDIFPEIGPVPFKQLAPMDVLTAVRRIEARGAHELAHRAMQIIGRICRYAVITERADRDPSYKLSEALKPAGNGRYAAFEIDELPKFWTELSRHVVQLRQPTINATELLARTFVRTGELIAAEWTEIDASERMWRIPGPRMKMKRDHLVPLSDQSLEILERQSRISGNYRFIFPHCINPDRHMSRNTVLKAIERLGYKGQMTGHGFRALAMSTIKEKLGYRHEVIDRQLGHLPNNKVDRAYDRAQFLDERKVMMQEWADYIDRVVREYQGKN